MNKDDNIISLPTKSDQQFIDALERPADPNVALQDLMASPSSWSQEAVASPEFAALDIDALFNLRSWVEAAIVAKGGEIVGAGIGCGGKLGTADLQVRLEGHEFNLEIRPLT